jgi:septal ring factor EnvC (AmiA/AmiB activator)
MELSREEVEDAFARILSQIEELTNKVKWQEEEHESFMVTIQNMEAEIDNVVQQLKIMSRAVEGMAQVLATHMGLPLADVYFNH